MALMAAPVAIVQAETQGEPPAETRGKCGFGGMNEHAAPLEVEDALALAALERAA